MERFLQTFGLSENEAKIYLYLLTEGTDTASIIAKRVNQSRTNVYMILTQLIEAGLVTADDTTNVRRFSAVHPKVFRDSLRHRQQNIVSLGRTFEMILPEMIASYNLAQRRPGVTYLEGIEGLKTSLEDEARAKTDILLWGSSITVEDHAVFALLEKAAIKRHARGIKTRMLLESEASSWLNIGRFAERGFDIRLTGKSPITSEIAMYDEKVSFTSYRDGPVVTILTNTDIAATFRVIFEEAWVHARIMSEKK